MMTVETLKKLDRVELEMLRSSQLQLDGKDRILTVIFSGADLADYYYVVEASGRFFFMFYLEQEQEQPFEVREYATLPETIAALAVRFMLDNACFCGAEEQLPAHDNALFQLERAADWMN